MIGEQHRPTLGKDKADYVFTEFTHAFRNLREKVPGFVQLGGTTGTGTPIWRCWLSKPTWRQSGNSRWNREKGGLVRC